MGVADSPLRDRVLFVVGAPRSGTTLLSALLAAHPEVAGITGESRLFEQGVGLLFENHEAGSHLDTYVTRGQLADLVRDLTDGVLERMRAETRPGARYALEKTPAPRRSPEVALERKRECYPDGWYVHIVREREAVVRSLMRAAFNDDPSRAASERWRDEGVAAVRAVLGDHERYREVTYEDLVADPPAVRAELFEWLRLDAGAEVLEGVSLLSRERFADHGPAGIEEAEPLGAEGVGPGPGGEGRRAGGLRGRLRRTALAAPLGRLRGHVRARRPEAVADRFAHALRAADAAALRELASPTLRLTMLSGEGDRTDEGEAAIAALAAIGRTVFGQRFLSESWTLAGGEGVTTFFSGVRHDGARVDLWWMTVVERGRVQRVGLMSAGSLEGRPLRRWSEPGAGEAGDQSGGASGSR